MSLDKDLNELNMFVDKLVFSIERPSSWEEAFMATAYYAAERSSCRHIYAGAVITKDKRIIATGYNGAPPNGKNCLELGCRKELYNVSKEIKGTGTCRGAHAESNALDQRSRDELIGTEMFTVFSPCSHCSKRIAANCLSKVYYSKMYEEPDSLTLELFSERKIELIKLELDPMKSILRLLKVYNQDKNESDKYHLISELYKRLSDKN